MMRSFFVMIAMLIGITLSAQTNLQYQAHVPFAAQEVQFSAYIADGDFDENSHLNSSALWYVENQTQQVNRGIIDVTLENIADSVFADREGEIFVYAYVNGQSLGKLPIYSMPYARFARVARLAGRAEEAGFARVAREAHFADTAGYSRRSGHARTSDSSDWSEYSVRSGEADVAVFAQQSVRSITSDTAIFSYLARHAESSETSDWATAADTANIAKSVRPNSIVLESIAGGSTAEIGSTLQRGANGIEWNLNPHYYTTDVTVVTVAPTQFPAGVRWLVSRVANDYVLPAPATPETNQLITVYNGSTNNRVHLLNTNWGIDTGANLQINPGIGRTLWFNGTVWVVIN